MSPALSLLIGGGVAAVAAVWCFAYGHDTAARIMRQVSAGMAASSWFLWAMSKIG